MGPESSVKDDGIIHEEDLLGRPGAETDITRFLFHL